MKLISSRIRDYKCIEDSDRFTIGPVTCLVGKNEAGKTAILEALHKLNPDVATKCDRSLTRSTPTFSLFQ